MSTIVAGSLNQPRYFSLRSVDPLVTEVLFSAVTTQSKTVVTCKIKHLQKCFRAVDSPRLCRGRKNVVKMFYFTCTHL